MAIYFTADQHFGHANIIKHTNRPFGSVFEMDRYMIDRWNERVGNDDTVYIVGDLIFRARLSPETYLLQLNGKKHALVGNHDKNWMRKVDLAAHFESVSEMKIISDGKRKIVLCHYPMMSYDGMNRGAYHVYGHIHNNTNDIYWPVLMKMANALNAGVDINGFAPVTMEELIANNATYKAGLELPAQD